jgi:hypothetical protein
MLTDLFTIIGADGRMEALRTGDWLTRERVTAVVAISAVCGTAMLLFLWLARHGTVDYFGSPVGSDFTAFWNAGRIANAGDASRAWDQRLLNDMIRHTHGVDYGAAWIYPPVFLLLAAPLAGLPYLSALFVWQALSFGALAVVLKAILKDSRATLIALASPLTPLVLANGQNSFITAALLGGGLLLAERKPGIAGGLLGGLVYKPQLAIVFGPLWLFTRNWRALAGSIIAALALVGLSIAIWGADCWPAWQGSLSYGRYYMEQGAVGFYKSASLFSMARLWGATVPIAYAVQAAGAIAGIALIWTLRAAPPLVRAAATCAAAAISTPYLLDYDMAVIGLGGAFLYAEARKHGFRSFERSALAFIWIAPWISRPAAEYARLPLGVTSLLLLTLLAWRRSPGVPASNSPKVVAA